jgi:hypothetical protein
MFKVQRSILAAYHVTQAQDFYKGLDLWKVPEDAAAPTSNSKQPPYRLSVQLPERGKKSLEETAAEAEKAGNPAEADDDPLAPVFSLTSVYTPNARDNLASFISVNSDATDPEYGSIRVEEQFRALLKYNPYSNVKPGTAYPAVLLETGINDPRVPPWHLAKMTARLQAATTSGRPILLATTSDAGHGVGTPLGVRVRQQVDQLVFLFDQLGMTWTPPIAGETSR